jgi:hypothetical protein
MLGVGGHCLPKDGILLWWRALEAAADSSGSLILEARRINDESPGATLALAERAFGSLTGRRVALLGAAYRGNSEDTRNSPTLAFAQLLLRRGAAVTIHDPYVYPHDQNLQRAGLSANFSRDLRVALAGAEFIVLCTPHKVYADQWSEIRGWVKRLSGVVDACNLFPRPPEGGPVFAGIGRGKRTPPAELVQAALEGFQAVERGVANEVSGLLTFLNARYAPTEFNRVQFSDVQRIAGTCPTGCAIVAPGAVTLGSGVNGFGSRLASRASGA